MGAFDEEGFLTLKDRSKDRDHQRRQQYLSARGRGFNGGKGGVTAQPTAQEKLAASEQHTGLTQQQTEHEHGASQNHELRASFNHGKPTIAATSHAAAFTGPGVVPAKGLATGPKSSTSTLGNPEPATPGSSPPGPEKRAKTFANAPTPGFSTGLKNRGPVANPAVGFAPPGSIHPKQPQNGPKVFAQSPPGKNVGANGRGPRVPQQQHQDKKPPKQQ